MGIEAATYISELVVSNPTGSDPKSQGDDHIRLLKSSIKNTFPNINGAVTASQAELNLLDGVTASTAELNILDGVTATASEINILDGATVTTNELNYVDGVTSAIQGQLNSKGAHAGQTWTGAHDFSGASGVTLPAATSIGSVDATEIGYINGVTSSVQDQINNLAGSKADISGESYTGVHNFTGATVNVPTATAGASGNNAASLDFVIATSFSSALPGQTGNSGKWLTTDGSNASWQPLPVNFSRLPIFSAGTLGLESTSSLEDITGSIYSTGLSSAVAQVIYDATQGLFIACPSTAEANIATSPNGVTWTLRTMPSSATWRVVTTSAGWLAYVYGGTATAWSTNAGASWTTKTSLGWNATYSAAVGSRILINGPTSGTSSAFSDDGGTSWTAATLPYASTSQLVAATASLFLVTGDSGKYWTSSTGATGSWTERSFPESVFIFLCKSQSSGVVIGYENSASTAKPAYKTSDGTNWTSIADGGVFGVIGPIAGVYAMLSTTFGGAKTWHKSSTLVRRASTVGCASNAIAAGNGSGLHVMGITYGSGTVMLVNESTYSKTGLFEV